MYCENGKYLTSSIDDSAMYDEIIESYNEETKAIPTNFNEKKATCKTRNFYTLHAFLVIIIASLIAVSICCYPMKYQAEKKHLLSFHVTNNKFKKICIDNINKK